MLLKFALCIIVVVIVVISVCVGVGIGVGVALRGGSCVSLLPGGGGSVVLH